jgi:hypothetical protein
MSLLCPTFLKRVLPLVFPELSLVRRNCLRHCRRCQDRVCTSRKHGEISVVVPTGSTREKCQGHTNLERARPSQTLAPCEDSRSPVDAFSFRPRPFTEEAISAHHTRLQNGIRQGPRQARQGHPRPRPYRYVPVAEQRQSSIVRREKESGKGQLERRGARTWEKTRWITRTRPWRIARLSEQIADGFSATQALAVVLPRSALSSWTTLPVPSSVTSRVPVRFSRLRRHCASTSVQLNH